jgi:hypothetical protein
MPFMMPFLSMLVATFPPTGPGAAGDGRRMDRDAGMAGKVRQRSHDAGALACGDLA